MLLKKFNMDITEKMVSFQIIQNVLIVKRTLVCVDSDSPCRMLNNREPYKTVLYDALDGLHVEII